MFRIAKNLVKTFEQSVSDTLSLSQDSNQLDAFFQSIPPNLLTPQLQQQKSLNDASNDVAQQHQNYRIQSNFNETLSGLRVVWVDELQLQFQSFFDYIIGLNDDPLPLVNNQHGYLYPDYGRIVQLFNESANSTLKVNVWNAKGGIFKDVYIQIKAKDESHMDEISLSNNNTSNEQNAALFERLGFKVQWTPLIASTFTYHILQLNIQNGPAQLAGLIPDEDYIVGCQDGLLATGGETLLQDIVRSRANHDLILYVYNKLSDCVRPITVHISADGRLGCGVGYGFLHRIPTVRQHTPTDENINSGDYISQANLQTSMPANVLPPLDSETSFVPSIINNPVNAGAPPPPKASQKKKKPAAKAALMSDYFMEGKDASPRPGSTSDSNAQPPPTSAKIEE